MSNASMIHAQNLLCQLAGFILSKPDPYAPINSSNIPGNSSNIPINSSNIPINSSNIPGNSSNVPQNYTICNTYSNPTNNIIKNFKINNSVDEMLNDINSQLFTVKSNIRWFKKEMDKLITIIKKGDQNNYLNLTKEKIINDNINNTLNNTVIIHDEIQKIIKINSNMNSPSNNSYIIYNGDNPIYNSNPCHNNTINDNKNISINLVDNNEDMIRIVSRPDFVGSF